MLSPYGDKLTDITTFPQTKNVDGGSIMDEIQMKWKRNANRTQFGRKFRAKPTRKGRKKAPFVGLWENGAKKRQPIEGCRSQSSMYFHAVPDVPDTGNCKRWPGKGCVQFLPHTPHMAAHRDIFIAKGFFFPDFFIDRKSTRLNSSHDRQSRMPSSA